MKINDSVIIKNIKFNIVINIKKIKKVYMRVKFVNNEYYLVISSFKKMTRNEIEGLIYKHQDGIIKLVNEIEKTKNNNDFLILGNSYKKEEVTEQLLKDAYDKINELFLYYRKVFNRNNTELKFRKMKTRWGVCFITKNHITLTKAVIHLPLYLTEYIIIHEFCHFKHPNHSKHFYEHVSRYCSDYKERKKELKKFSYTLN